eukprot:3295353-Pleurochrysis_carterae.AAC.2
MQIDHRLTPGILIAELQVKPDVQHEWDELSRVQAHVDDPRRRGGRKLDAADRRSRARDTRIDCEKTTGSFVGIVAATAPRGDVAFAILR